MGTGGALSLMPPPTSPLLVINGDILTKVDFKAMYAFHRENNADITMAVSRHILQMPYGVVKTDGTQIQSIVEKPQIDFFINAGIYLLEPTVYKYIEVDQQFNMTDLVQKLLDASCTVISFPIIEYWVDIGQLSDYQRAQEDFDQGKMSS
jgi:NDP-sugar pyrophosphorylase family protein